MGQQQLILLVLATVIVGIAIVVGIRAFTENSAKSNADAMIQDAVRIANDLQAWKKKPAPFGGQASTQTNAVVVDQDNFTGADWEFLGYVADNTGVDDTGTALADSYTNLNGSYVLTATATGANITGYNALEQNEIQVQVCGMSDADIDGVIIDLGGNATGSAAPTCA